VARFVLGDASPVPSEADVYKQPTTVQEILGSYEKSIEAVRQIFPRWTTPA
jgi:hypothetical protein